MQTGSPGAATPPPIFLFGVLERSGTNFLSDLVCLHPDCRPAHPLDEAFLHFRAELLDEYVHGTVAKWHPDWGLSEQGAATLLAAIGHGLRGFLAGTSGADGDGRRLVVKTPSVKNLHMFPRLFPNTPAIVLMRDGRSVVESGVRSFSFTHEEQTRKWAWAARVIADTVGTRRGPGAFDPASPFLLVRYEDLVTEPESELRRVFGFAGLDADAYDFSAVEALPVRGSSTYRGSARGEGGERVTWEPVERSADFNPLERWREWPPALHDRFNWLAGSELAAFGYEPVRTEPGIARWLRNRARDVRWRFWPERRAFHPREAAS